MGDGNINFVYILEGPAGALCVKQALPYVRCIGESWPLSQVCALAAFRATGCAKCHRTGRAALAVRFLARTQLRGLTQACARSY